MSTMQKSPYTTAADEWGWTRYERLPWVNANGRKAYRGHFRTDTVLTVHGQTYSEAVIDFWARRPVLALRYICQSLGVDHALTPLDFDGQEIN